MCTVFLKPVSYLLGRHFHENKEHAQMPTISTTIHHCPRDFCQFSQVSRGHKNGFEDHIIVYLENTKRITIKQIQTIKQFSEVTGNKISIQKSISFMYPNNKQPKGWRRRTIENSSYNSHKNVEILSNKLLFFTALLRYQEPILKDICKISMRNILHHS